MILVPSPVPATGAPWTDGALPSPVNTRDGHARIHFPDGAIDVVLPDVSATVPIAALVLLADDTPDRLHALHRLWSGLRGDPVPPDDRLTSQRRQRLREMLRAIDGRAENATYRTIGETLFPRHQIDARSWVGHPVRETTIRLVRDGIKLVSGGYRALLRRPHRS
ncbi:DUF2285 domain-containing protein [Sinorhizobium medicae]|nr:DUF2285 domain-containing protein [Sinorhizobium medicae]